MAITIDEHEWLALEAELPAGAWKIYELAYLLISARRGPVSEVELRRRIGNRVKDVKGHLSCLVSRGIVALVEGGKVVIQAAIDAVQRRDHVATLRRASALKSHETRLANAHANAHANANGVLMPSNQLNLNETDDANASASRASFPNLFEVSESVSKNQKTDSPNPAPLPLTPLAEPAPLPLQPDGRKPAEPSMVEQQKKYVELEREFEEVFWPAYPLRKGKGAARPKFVRARAKASLEAIMAGVDRYVVEKRGVEPRYIKHPATWLNGECWEDAPSLPVSGGRGGYERPAFYGV